MMGFKKKRGFSILLILLLGGILLTFSPFRNKVKGFLAGLLSATTVAMKEDKTVPEGAYNWILADRQGNPLKFKALKGEVIIINFWATWCGPCIAEMPSLQKLYDEYGENVNFLFVTTDDTNKVDNFLKKGYDLPVYYPKTTVPDIFYSKTIPTTFIIDKKGRIVTAKSGEANWFDDDIQSLLGRLLMEQ